MLADAASGFQHCPFPVVYGHWMLSGSRILAEHSILLIDEHRGQASALRFEIGSAHKKRATAPLSPLQKSTPRLTCSLADSILPVAVRRKPHHKGWY
jgi:hypothetical protein